VLRKLFGPKREEVTGWRKTLALLGIKRFLRHPVFTHVATLTTIMADKIPKSINYNSNGSYIIGHYLSQKSTFAVQSSQVAHPNCCHSVQ
jgi:hypothetical protein